MSWQSNRAAQLWRNWEDKEKMLLEVFGQGKLSENLTREKYEFLSAGILRISGSVSPDEKLVLGLIKKSVGKLERQLYPHPVTRFAHQVKRMAFDRPLADYRFERLKAQNMVSLGAAVKKLGLDPEKIQLEKQLDYARPEINLCFSSPYGVDQRFEISLGLEKGSDGHYQLQGYTGTLGGRDASDSRSFKFDTASGITIHEAANLLQGRAILKPFSNDFGEEGAKWIQLEFGVGSNSAVLREMGAGAGFDLKQQVDLIAEKLHRPELSDLSLLKGLEQGKQVELKQLNGEAVFLEAAPLLGKVLIRNAQQQEVSLEKLGRKRDRRLAAVPELKVAKPLDKEKHQSQSLGIA